jgi:hypothetical protein
MAIKITANAAGVAKGVDQATGFLKAGAPKMAAEAAKAGQGAADALASKFASTLKVAIGAAIAAAPFATAGALYKEGAEHILALGKAAEGTATDLKSMQIIAAALGDTEFAAKAMDKYAEAMTNFALAGAGADTPLSRLGLDADKLLSAPVYDALGQIADRIKALPHPLLQAAAAGEFFGAKMADDILPTLLKGSAYLDKTRQSLEAFGAAFGAGDLASVRAAAEAWKQIAYFRQGLSNQVAIGLAPILAEISARLPSLAEMGLTAKNLAGWIVDAAEAAAQFVATIVDLTHNFDLMARAGGAAWAAIEAGFKRIVEMVLRLAATIADALDMDQLALGLRAKATGYKWASWLGFHEAKFEWKRLMAELTDPGRNAPATNWVVDFFDKVRARMAAAGKDAQKNNPFGLWLESAKKMADALDDPVKKFQDAMANIKKLSNLFTADDALAMLDQGFPMSFVLDPLSALQPGVGERTAYKAFMELRNAIGAQQGYQPTPALLAGTREAYSAITAHQMTTSESIEQALQRLLGEANDHMKTQHRIGRQIIAAVQKNNLKLRGID